MYKSILIASDGSQLADKAVENGLALAKAISARVVAVTVQPLYPYYSLDPGFEKSNELDQVLQEQSKKLLGGVAAKATAAGVPCETLAVSADQPYEAIIDTAKKKACDLIVMASHGRSGMTAVVLGSQAQKVLTHSTIPVLVYR